MNTVGEIKQAMLDFQRCDFANTTVTAH
jgi:hypothetical protein